MRFGYEEVLILTLKKKLAHHKEKRDRDLRERVVSSCVIEKCVLNIHLSQVIIYCEMKRLSKLSRS